MIQEIKNSIRQLGDQDFRELRAWVITEEASRRREEPAIRRGQQEIISELQDSGKIPKPEYANVEGVKPGAAFPDWVSPGTTHALMYPRGAVVKNNDRVWESQLDMNHWEPGAFGVDEYIWRDITHLTELKEAEDVEEVEDNEGVEGGEENTGEETPPPPAIPFGPGLPLLEGDIVEHEGDHYRVISPHTTASHWPPDQAHALFEKIESPQ